MNDLLSDVRYALRTLSRSPGFAAAAIATLALGIGANTAVFSVVDSLILRPPPGLAQPGSLVWISGVQRGRLQGLSYPDFEDLRLETGAFSGVFAVSRAAAHVARGRDAERIRAHLVSDNAFDVAGSKPALGRTFLPDDAKEARPVAVIGHRYWERAFDSDPGAVGSTLNVNGRAFTIIGVAAEELIGFRSDPEEIADIYLLFETYYSGERRRNLENRDSAWLLVQARLRPGVSVEEASAAAAVVVRRRAASRSAEMRDLSAAATPLQGWVPPGQLKDVLPFALFGLIATGLVLSIACANVANLLLARAAGRRKEIGIRLAIGASRSRIVRQLLTESVLLAALGAGAGLLLALWTIDLILNRFGAPAAIAPRLDFRIAAYAAAAAFATGITFGLAPAWKASRRALVPSLKGEASEGAERSRLPGGLVVAQVSISLVLLAAAGLLVRSFQKAAAVDIGLERRHAARTLAASFDVETQGYGPERSREFFRALLDRAGALPGVESAALAETLPLSGRAVGDAIAPKGEVPRPGDSETVFVNTVSPGYFETLGVPILAGRDFTEADREGAPPVVIVNETLARRFWPGQDPLGKFLQTGGERAATLQVVGVARDGKYLRMTEAPRPFAYFSILQQGARHGETILIARFSGPPSVEALRSEVRALDPSLPLFRVRSLERLLEDQLADRRNGTLVVEIFGVLAICLAVVGLYGVLSHSVTRRRREIGIRMALGASPAQVRALFLRRGGKLASIGIAIGLALSAAVTRLLSQMLFGVAPTDAATFLAVTLLLSAVALAAAWLPARRATRVDPMAALRSE
ncbi:MAG TPA: ABC transporter permease [Thermoanaerobaculia bacterium]|nr:ABC transporter permease [Thermoanaerobaculia bacterium]